MDLTADLEEYNRYLEQNCLTENQPPQTIPYAERIIPEWLFQRVDTRTARPLSPLERDLLYATFEHIFEYVLEMLSGGEPLDEILGSDPRNINKGRFIAWVLDDPERKALYDRALKVSAEIEFGRIPAMADASDTLEDVARTNVKINALKYRLGVLNRERFGDIKRIEQDVNINIADAMQRAEQRVIDVTPRGN